MQLMSNRKVRRRRAHKAGGKSVTRRNLAREVREPFEDIVRRYGLEPHVGQTKKNRIPLPCGATLEFGDLRVDLTDKQIIVEIESAGGLTNLIKYLYCLEKDLVRGPIVLLHLYSQSTPGDHAAHIRMWEYFRELMSMRLKDRFKACLFRFNYDSPGKNDGLEDALREFESLIELGSTRD